MMLPAAGLLQDASITGPQLAAQRVLASAAEVTYPVIVHLQHDPSS